MFFLKKPVVDLPKIKASTAAELAPKMNAQPAAQALITPGMTPPQYLNTLEQNKMPLDAVNLLANGMPEQESVWWAAQSSQKVGDKLNPAEKSAVSAAEAWVKNPNPDTQAAAAAAAAKTDYSGPGGWTAQAAAWAKGPTPASPAATAPATPAIPATQAAPGTPAAPNLTAAAVSGAVLLASGLVNRPAMPATPQKPQSAAPQLKIPQLDVPKLEVPKAPAAPAPTPPPVDQSKMAKTLQPFIDLGKDVASGKNTWA